jgi:group I intron endonuclease
MNKYEHGKIYKLVNNVDADIYIGSTLHPLVKRLSLHKSHGKVRNSKVYRHLKEVGLDNVHIELIEEYPCTCRKELEDRERYWIENLKPALNKNIPSRTLEELKEIKRCISRVYNEIHRERINARMKELYWLKKEKMNNVTST